MTDPLIIVPFLFIAFVVTNTYLGIKNNWYLKITR